MRQRKKKFQRILSVVLSAALTAILLVMRQVFSINGNREIQMKYR